MILVTGASGSVGRRVIRILKAEGRELRAMVRTPAECGVFEAMDVPALVGDVRRAVNRAAALIGVDEVIACHSAYHDYVHQDIRAVDGQATVDLIRDSAAAGLRHFTLLSHQGADRPAASARLTAKREAELALLAQESMSYTILRLAPLMDELTRLPGLTSTGAGRHLILFGDGHARIAPLSPLDAARIAAQCSRIEAARRETFEVGGPETFTWLELGTIFERAWDERVQTWRLPLFLLSLARVIAGWLKPRVAERLAYLETLYTTDFGSDPSRIAALFSLGLEDLETFLSRDEADEADEVSGLSADALPSRAVEPPSPPTDVAEPDLPSRATESPHHGEMTLDEEPSRALETPPPRPWHAPEPAAEEWPAPAEPEPAPVLEPPAEAEVDLDVPEVELPPEPEPVAEFVEPSLADELVGESVGEPTEPEVLPAAEPPLEEDVAPEPVGEPPLPEPEGPVEEDLVAPPVAEPVDEAETPAREPVIEGQPIPPERLPEPEPAAEPEPDDATPPEVEETEAVLPPDEADEADEDEPWGRHGEFDRPPALPVDPEERRPRVERPKHTDSPVVDLDEE